MREGDDPLACAHQGRDILWGTVHSRWKYDCAPCARVALNECAGCRLPSLAECDCTSTTDGTFRLSTCVPPNSFFDVCLSLQLRGKSQKTCSMCWNALTHGLRNETS